MPGKPLARIATPEEYAEVARQWGVITGDLPFGPEEEREISRRLSWWLGDTPNGPGVLAVVEEGGEYLGIAGWCPKQLVIGGESVPIAEIGTTMTSPAARGRGVFSSLVGFLLEAAEERQLKAIYGTPNRASGEIYLGRLGFRAAWPWQRWIRARRGLFRLPFDVAMLIRSANRGVRSEGTVSRLDSFDDTPQVTDSDWHKPHLDKTAEYLSWRYPEDRYSAYSLADSDGIAAWAVIGTATRLGRRALVIADAAVAPQAEQDAPGFLNASLSMAASRFSNPPLVFSMTAPAGSLGATLRKLGAISRPSEMPLIVKPVGDDGEEVADALTKLAFVAGDSDTV